MNHYRILYQRCEIQVSNSAPLMLSEKFTASSDDEAKKKYEKFVLEKKDDRDKDRYDYKEYPIGLVRIDQSEKVTELAKTE